MSKSRYFSTTGIILRKQQSGEHDWFLTIFSPEYGKIQAISKASRKITSHKGSHLDPLNLCVFQFYQNGTRLLLTECRTERVHINLKSNLERSLIGLALSELIIKSVHPEQENPELFSIFINTLEQLEKAELSPLQLAEFKIKLLKNAGSWPDLSLCFFCTKKWSEQNKIWIDQEGHLACQDCLTLTRTQPQLISFDTVKLATFLANYGCSDLKIQANQQILHSLQKLTDQFLQQYFQYQLKSQQILSPN